MEDPTRYLSHLTMLSHQAERSCPAPQARQAHHLGRGPDAARFCMEAVDRLLRDITGIDVLFGGIAVVFSDASFLPNSLAIFFVLGD